MRFMSAVKRHLAPAGVLLKKFTTDVLVPALKEFAVCFLIGLFTGQRPTGQGQAWA